MGGGAVVVSGGDVVWVVVQWLNADCGGGAVVER